jgi:AcrR family transcriptional regulator
MPKPATYRVWIENGYALFAQDGLDGIQVERLAKMVSLNKSGFYHYFGDRESFLEELMKHHYANSPGTC